MGARWEKQEKPSELERQILALTREGEAYAANGMRESVLLVNEQLALRGADPVVVPGEAVRQVRKSTQAATRRKAKAAADE